MWVNFAFQEVDGFHFYLFFLLSTPTSKLPLLIFFLTVQGFAQLEINLLTKKGDNLAKFLLLICL